MRNAQMYLQGIEPAARLQLLALCLASLERQTSLLHEHNSRSSWGARGGGGGRDGREVGLGGAAKHLSSVKTSCKGTTWAFTRTNKS